MISLERHIFPALAGLACIPLGMLLRSGEVASVIRRVAAPRAERAPIPGNGSQLLGGWIREVEKAADSEVPGLADRLLKSPHREDMAMWAPVLARLSSMDPQGMLTFAGKVPLSLRERLLGEAWFAYGSANPQQALADGKRLPYALTERLMAGVMETDPGTGEVVATLNGTLRERWLMDLLNRDPERVEGIAEGLGANGKGWKDIANIGLSEDWVESNHKMLKKGLVEPLGRLLVTRDPVGTSEMVDAMSPGVDKTRSMCLLAEDWAAEDSAAAIDWIKRQPESPAKRRAMLTCFECDDLRSGTGKRPRSPLDRSSRHASGRSRRGSRGER
ncbi:MAG: hypothetical protein QM755_04150 [Luteolibacter sp.]